MWVGAHLSIGQGLTAAVHTAVKIGANTLQFFMRNPRGGKMCVVDKEDYEGAWVLMRSMILDHWLLMLPIPII